ncbi:hypothetical protein [Alkaliphilus crotonatoxidans]
MRPRRSFFSLLLCLVPGAAHLYLGLKKQGIQLMTLFVMPIFFTDILKFSAFLSIVPIIWCYSFFDALRKVNGYDELEDRSLFIFDWISDEGYVSREKHRLLAYGLIILGGILIFQRILMPMVSRFINWETREYIEISTISILLILGGVKLLGTGNKKEKEQNRICEDGE